MNKSDFTTLLNEPQSITQSQSKKLNAIITDYPYFQSARALQLKGIKQFEPSKYNTALKITAAYTTDRSVLFDFITSEVFQQNTISEYIKDNNIDTDEIKAITVVSKEIVQKEDKTSTNPLNNTLKFNTQEKHSFNDWLSKIEFKPINRNNEEATPPTTKTKNARNREDKFKLIDEFIKKNPKLVPAKKNAPKVNIANERSIKPETLMTETLAKIYVEQENYGKAIQSYKILSLKYPEKSSFFADRIKAIKKLQKNQQKKT